MSSRRVVITGLGMLSPLGADVESTWKGIVAGENGIATIDSFFDVSTYSCQFGGGVKGFEPTEYMSLKEARRLDPFVQYGLAAGIQAFQDCGIEVNEENTDRIGVAIGAGIGGLSKIEDTYDVIKNADPSRISPFFVPGSIINMVAGNLSIRFSLRGPNLALVTACASGTHNIGFASRLIASDDADMMLAGGAEMSTTPVGLGGFCSARSLSKRNNAPEVASRPWDKDRDGFVLGDGAGVIALEEYEHAKRRGAKIYAEIKGFGMSGDAHHITSPPEDGRGAATSMKNALRDARMNPEDIQYINAHGTSTQVGDRAEAAAMKSAFGNSAYQVAISSTKSMIGHLLGAAGAVEAIFSVLAIRDQIAPPTINLDEPGEGCDLDFVPHRARQINIRNVLSNSFGFGGTNGSIIISRIE